MAGKNFPISLIVKAVDKATAPLRQVSASLGDISKQVASAGKALTLGVSAPLAAMAAGSVAAFSHFEAGMASVSTLVDTSSESMDALAHSVLAIGKRVPVALSDLTGALYDVRSAGVSAADSMKVLEGSARLAVAGLGTTKEATDLVTSSINAFGLQGEEQQRVYDLIFKTVKAGKTTISQLAQGFGGVAGTVAAAGIGLDEYLASVAALTTTGLPASEAHTQLKSVISGLTGETKEAEAIFARLGAKSFKDLIATSGGLVPALQRVRSVVKDNDKVLLKAVGGSEAFNAALGLTGRQGASYESTLEGMRSGVNALDEAFEKQSATGAATMQKLRNSLEAVAISIGRVLVPVLQQLAPMLERAAEWWEGLGAEGQKSIIIMAGAAAALGPTITVMGNLATAVGIAGKSISFIAGWGKYLWMMRASIMAGLVPSLTAAATSVWGFTAALLANPITWVVAAVAALGAAAYLIYENWEPIKAFFLDTWESIKSVVGDALAWVGEHLAWTPFGMIVNNWGPIKDFFADLWAGVVAHFERAWERISPIVDALKTARDFYFGGEDAAPVGALGAGAERPTLGAAQMPPGAGVLAPQQAETRVVVDFSNLPRGTRVSEAPGGTAPLDLGLGYGMVGG